MSSVQQDHPDSDTVSNMPFQKTWSQPFNTRRLPITLGSIDCIVVATVNYRSSQFSPRQNEYGFVQETLGRASVVFNLPCFQIA
jgi:hypothetical protein